MRHRGHSGLGLVAAGLALLAAYAVLVWYGVYDNGEARQVCGVSVPHRDNFFPPYTACGSGGHRYRITSDLVEYAGASLFILAAAMFVGGAVLVIVGRGYGGSGQRSR